MASASIALLVPDRSFSLKISGMLADAGFEINDVYADSAAHQDLSYLGNYDLVILGIDGSEEARADIFDILLSVRGFVIAGSGNGIQPIFSGPMRHITPDMSPEDIVFRINDALFQYKNIRKSPRIGLRLEIEYLYGGTVFQSSILNLSSQGAFISTLNPPPVNSLLSVRFRLPGSRDIYAECRVLYSIGYDLDRGIISHPASSGRKITAVPGMGVFFEKISDKVIREIELFIDGRVY